MTDLCGFVSVNREDLSSLLARWVWVPYLIDMVKKPVKAEIPRKAIYRLSVYLRCLQRLKANDIRTVSSAVSKAFVFGTKGNAPARTQFR